MLGAKVLQVLATSPTGGVLEEDWQGNVSKGTGGTTRMQIAGVGDAQAQWSKGTV